MRHGSMGTGTSGAAGAAWHGLTRVPACCPQASLALSRSRRASLAPPWCVQTAERPPCGCMDPPHAILDPAPCSPPLCNALSQVVLKHACGSSAEVGDCPARSSMRTPRSPHDSKHSLTAPPALAPGRSTFTAPASPAGSRPPAMRCSTCAPTLCLTSPSPFREASPTASPRCAQHRSRQTERGCVQQWVEGR